MIRIFSSFLSFSSLLYHLCSFWRNMIHWSSENFILPTYQDWDKQFWCKFSFFFFFCCKLASLLYYFLHHLTSYNFRQSYLMLTHYGVNCVDTRFLPFFLLLSLFYLFSSSLLLLTSHSFDMKFSRVFLFFVHQQCQVNCDDTRSLSLFIFSLSSLQHQTSQSSYTNFQFLTWQNSEFNCDVPRFLHPFLLFSLQLRTDSCWRGCLRSASSGTTRGKVRQGRNGGRGNEGRAWVYQWGTLLGWITTLCSR